MHREKHFYFPHGKNKLFSPFNLLKSGLGHIGGDQLLAIEQKGLESFFSDSDKGLMQRPVSSQTASWDSTVPGEGQRALKSTCLWGTDSCPTCSAQAADSPLSRLEKSDHKEAGFNRALKTDYSPGEKKGY